jgi:Na+-driven multidrug efflux pump
MQHFTTGSNTPHLTTTAGLMLVLIAAQTSYVLVDRAWAGRVGTATVAAVGSLQVAVSRANRESVRSALRS